MTQPVAIASDSSIDLPPPEAVRRGIALAPIQVAFSREYFRDTDLPRAEFYRRLKDEPRLPTIAAAMPADFVAAYRDAARLGKKILCLINPFESCSTYTAAYSATVALRKENLQLEIEVLNTGRALTGLGAVCIAAADLAASGADMAEVVAAIEAATPQIDAFYAPATIEYLQRDGRISMYEMQVGSLERMLPLIRVWGRIAVVDKSPTQAENVAKMLERAEAALEGREAYVIVTHGQSPSAAEELAARVPRRLNCRHLMITELGPSAGSYCGAGTVGMGYCPSLLKLNSGSAP